MSWLNRKSPRPRPANASSLVATNSGAAIEAAALSLAASTAPVQRQRIPAVGEAENFFRCRHHVDHHRPHLPTAR